MFFFDIDYSERKRRQMLVDRTYAWCLHYSPDYHADWLIKNTISQYNSTLQECHEVFLSKVQKAQVGFVSPTLEKDLDEKWLGSILEQVRTNRISDHATQRHGCVETPQGRVYWAIAKARSFADIFRALASKEPFRLELWHPQDVDTVQRPKSALKSGLKVLSL